MSRKVCFCSMCTKLAEYLLLFSLCFSALLIRSSIEIYLSVSNESKTSWTNSCCQNLEPSLWGLHMLVRRSEQDSCQSTIIDLKWVHQSLTVRMLFCIARVSWKISSLESRSPIDQKGLILIINPPCSFNWCIASLGNIEKFASMQVKCIA